MVYVLVRLILRFRCAYFPGHTTPIPFQNEVLLQPFSPEEIKCALDQMYPYKSPGPDAFIHRRLITSNIFVAYELNHYLSHKRWGSVGHVALKLGISKACDRIEWVFLERVLLRLGFHKVFSCMVQQEEGERGIQGVAVCRRAPRVSHLLFADDTLLFCQATVEAMERIKVILTKF
ncbi:UNVERIFIED_CONTAM: hypothetical protein Slati_1683600 [Sesamum latifolium]|uniref:Reverse transcriptase n=1 Tax=Sesamum latifolium TaxID=2727402 RepID=A0AAW2WUK3_9LAMI